jgi:predicted Co/Zn/Cd cation transporter (cation efflux family)
MPLIGKNQIHFNKMKNKKQLFGKGRQQRRIETLQAAHARTQKHTWYLELLIAACLGASLALGFVVAHGMITTQWTW